MDLIYALASIRSDTGADDGILEKIEDKSLQDIALMAPWLSKLTSVDAIWRIQKASHTKAKIYLLQQWCQQNKSDARLADVIDAALDMVIADASYTVPLRHLRQLSDGLRNCVPERIEQLSKRFDIPNFTSSPLAHRRKGSPAD